MKFDKCPSKKEALFRQEALACLDVLLRTARYLCHDEQLAEDLVQETMLRAWRKFDSYESGTRIKAWLLTILRRVHVDWYRKNHKHDAISLEVMAATGHEPASKSQEIEAGCYDQAWDRPEDLLARFDDSAIIESLKHLPEGLRWALLLVDIEQLSHQEAATILDVAVGTIKSRTHRGRAMLRDQLFELAQKRGWVTQRSFR